MTNKDDKKPKQNTSNDDPYFITGEALDRHFKLNELLLEFHDLFNHGEKNERAIAIVGATFLETLLEHILWAFLIDDQNEVKKLLRSKSFNRYIMMAYCLGLINKPVRDDLDLVRQIRNEFAHTLNVSFEDKTIKSWCASLKWHQITHVADPLDNATAQELFQVGVNQLIAHLGGVVSIARGKKRTTPRY